MLKCVKYVEILKCLQKCHLAGFVKFCHPRIYFHQINFLYSPSAPFQHLRLYLIHCFIMLYNIPVYVI